MLIIVFSSIAGASIGTREGRRGAAAAPGKPVPPGRLHEAAANERDGPRRQADDGSWKDDDAPEEEPRAKWQPRFIVARTPQPSRFETYGGAIVATVSTVSVLWYLFGGKKKKTKGGPKSTKEPLLSTVKYLT
jgi:hypothetical protein